MLPGLKSRGFVFSPATLLHSLLAHSPPRHCSRQHVRFSFPFPAAPTRLLHLLAASPYLIKVISYLEISVDATISDDLESLLSIFRGPPDSVGRYHSAGPLRSVALVKIILRDLAMSFLPFSHARPSRPSTPFSFPPAGPKSL